MERSLPYVLIAAVLAAAGCVAPPAEEPVDPAGAATTATFPPLTPEAPDFDFSTVVDPDHANHQLPVLHEGGHGLSLVGHAGIQDIAPPGMRASITQVDVHQQYALVSGMEGGMAFAIVDISDPAAPKALSVFPSAADGWTARFSEDGNFVFYGCQNLVGAQATVAGNCEDPTAPHPPPVGPFAMPPSGVIAVDVTDKSAPKFAHFLPTGGSHNIFYAQIDGEDYIFTAATTILHFDRETMQLEQIAEVPGVHDATVAKHPITGDWLLITGTSEMTIYNVNDPANPEIVYEGKGDEGWVGWHDQVLIPGVVDGKVILVLSGESFLSPSGVPDIVSFVDVTDPANPVLLSQWQPPFQSQLPWVSYLYSVHEMAATPTGQVAISWYHGGVWVVDVSTAERQAEPAILAAYLPNMLPNVVPSTFQQTPVPVVPFVWSVGWDARGYLVVPDMHTGLYVLEPSWGLHPALDSGA